MNKIVLIGNLVRDTEFGTTNSGVPYCRFSIAVNRAFTKDTTDFFNVVAWRSTAESCARNLAKGSKVCVYGSMQTRKYESENGTRTIYEVMAEEVEFLSFKQQAEEQKQNEPKQTSMFNDKSKSSIADLEPVSDDDSLPF